MFLTEVTSDDVKPDATRGWMSPRRNRVLANVTDLGVLIKVGTSSGLVWVTSLATGKPVSGARVAVYRGLYRPGETASFKGIAREVISGQAPRVPAKAPVTVEVSDSRGAVVLTTTTKLSAFGGFAFELPQGLEAATGDYYVSATVADQRPRARRTGACSRRPVAEQAGETVPPEVFANGINALETWVASKASLAPDGDGATAAMAAYVMALRGKPDVALMARLYGVRAGMPKWGQAFLLRAMAKAKSDPAMVAALEKLLVADLVVTGDRAVVKEGLNKEQYVDYMDSDVRATAMTLAALLEADPKSALVDPLAAGLKSQRLASGSWESTQENLWSLVALSAWARRSPGGTTTLAVTVGGTTTRRTITGTQVATQTFAVGDAGAGAIAISVDSPANITARVKEARVDAGAAVANGFAIERHYVNAAGIEQAAFEAGDVVTVKLTVVVDAAQKWVALVDPLPAGLEVMNSKLAAGGVRTKATPGADAASDGNGGPVGDEYWRGLQWVRQDLRDDRVEWFADSIGAGTYEMNYQARATLDGTFATMPATIEAMYEPTIRGRTTRGKLVVTK